LHRRVSPNSAAW